VENGQWSVVSAVKWSEVAIFGEMCVLSLFIFMYLYVCSVQYVVLCHYSLLLFVIL
jgi:hypothetical protein